MLMRKAIKRKGNICRKVCLSLPPKNRIILESQVFHLVLYEVSQGCPEHSNDKSFANNLFLIFLFDITL